MKNSMLVIFRHVWTYVEEYCAIAAAILTLLLDYLGKWEGKTMPVLLGILAFIAYQLVKAKNKMTGVSEQAKCMLQELHGMQRQQVSMEFSFAMAHLFLKKRQKSLASLKKHNGIFW